jgi:CBS domain containing-hemolysin-like protein
VVAVLLILLAVAMVLACGAFVAAEFALLTVQRSAVEQAAAAGDRRAAGVLQALKTLSTQLSGAQVGITITNLVIGLLAEPAIANLLDGPLADAGLSHSAASATAVIIALALSTAVTMVVGELIPKNLALAVPLATARAVQGFHRAFSSAIGPVIVVLNGAANAILGLFGLEAHEELASARSPQELAALVRRSSAQGTLESATARLVQRSLAFGERNVRDVLTPRVRMHTVDATGTLADVVQAVRETGHSRFPVVGTDIDDIVGLVSVRDVVMIHPADRSSTPIARMMSTPLIVPESLRLDALAEMFGQVSQEFAIVADEYGGVSGIVTREDLVEELVGAVVDEHDEAGDPEPSVHTAADSSWTVSGLLRPDEVEEATGIALPEHGVYETVAGLVMQALGRIPEVGDDVVIDAPPGALWDFVRITVEAMDGLRIDSLTIRPEGQRG